ncbi:hypothetical protein [Streptomyces spongiae]|uniref:Uncharacterized protein n=1 Tax=Streptomyces spongiae TaxID=565072 RepID=A0A5N8XS27_9ACTN|nr:hypothetical protein [Streptomyces spongiae]MPY62212.1 hypothetical protein [Streptomyces spongiae]
MRLAALIGAAVAAVALPLAVASAGPVGDAGRMVARMSGLTDGTARTTDGGAWDAGVGEGEGVGEVREDARAAPSRPPHSLGTGLATATRCGPDLSSPDGIEAQTCVLTEGEKTWARTYYRNATGSELSSALSLMTPDGRSVRMHCVVGAQDEPGVCETPREPTRGDLEAYTAVAEFASNAGQSNAGHGPLLLRSGSNSPQRTGG